MENRKFTKSQLPIRKTKDLLPNIFQTNSNERFLSGTVDALVQPGYLEKIVGYAGKRYGKTFNSNDVYVDTDNTLRSRYQLEPGVVVDDGLRTTDFYDYIDLKNQLRFFGNTDERDYLVTEQQHYVWNPPIDWDKFINFREYFWVPSGPPPVLVQGQAQNIISTYRVKLGDVSTWIFYPDGLTNNPQITLYRGQTYKFIISAPGENFTLRTNYDTGSLSFDPARSYKIGELVLYDNALWRAVKETYGDGSTINLETEDWEFVEPASTSSSLDYNLGVENNGLSKGTLTFTVPLNAPDVLYYQSKIDPDRLGRFVIADVDTNTFIDLEKEIIGKSTYISSNGIEFTNGLSIRFEGLVAPESYANKTWIVEGVGESIRLIDLDSLIVPIDIGGTAAEVLFDNSGFDTEPFDDASAYPGSKDYITINRSSKDVNPWSRYNRWFHRSVLEYAHKFNDSNFDSSESSRAKRPIIEFKADLQLYNYGSIAKQNIDFLDDFTTDVFSTIEGSLGYNIDGEDLFENARVLFVNDRDILTNNKIYTVRFITHNGRRQIHLEEAEDTVSVLGESVLVRRGIDNAGDVYHFDGINWIISQQKKNVNQPPLFDLYDTDGNSFSSADNYSVSSFAGTSIISYKIGTGYNDRELGFPLSYLNIDNVGDIEFNFALDADTFSYLDVDKKAITKSLAGGFYKFNNDKSFQNSWIEADNAYHRPIIDSIIVVGTPEFTEFKSIDWSQYQRLELFVYKNKQITEYRREGSRFYIPNLKEKDVVEVRVFTDTGPDTGYYNLPLGIEKNPLNQNIENFTLGTATDHVASGLEFFNAFQGTVIGNNNLRDIEGYQSLSTRFVKHKNIAAINMLTLCDKSVNVIKSLRYAKNSYREFKNNFLNLASTLFYNQNPTDFVDEIITEMTRSKTVFSPFYQSDMIGSGAFSSIDYVVEDEGIKTFALTQIFDLETNSDRAVYVYHNNRQLLAGLEYEFNSDFGFVSIAIDLQEGDRLQIREYVSTSSSFIPPTPTKLGLYKKYTPRIFLDDTFVEPKLIIQGHDGSLNAAFGDYRDDIILELEYRIYNNIKQIYDEKIFDIDGVVSGYYYKGDFDKKTVDEILSREFLHWLSGTSEDFTNNRFFESENSFTYTYSQMLDPTESVQLPGYWRGIYHWFYDTDRPHTCPWEMLGFSEKPIWWEEEYGPAPYTNGNLILWDDIRDGFIRQGPRKGLHPRYARTSIRNHIPVDDNGNLLSPLESGLARKFALINNKGDFIFGDRGPIEHAWRSSSDYPFSLISALSILKPFEFIASSLDRSLSKNNILNQSVNQSSGLFITISDYIARESYLITGLINYIIDHSRAYQSNPYEIYEKIQNLDVKLSHRLSGFVDQNQQKFILDSKSPRSSSSNIFVPVENYEIFFNVSAPTEQFVYSGVIVEKTSTGFKIIGYDDIDMFFRYFEFVPSKFDAKFSIGGLSEKFVRWNSNSFYVNGVICLFQENYYRAIRTHTSSDSFDNELWTKLPDLPLIGGSSGLRRTNFIPKEKKLAYGTIFRETQQVVDFLQGYEKYLESRGFIFEDYDSANQTVKNWLTAAKEFLFWTLQNWQIGSIISLSPGANKLTINSTAGVADNLFDSFYDYAILGSNGTPLAENLIDVKRDFQRFEITTTIPQTGIYFARVNYVFKEHVAIFSDKTVFNDVVYDKPTGYRQERIKVRSFRTVDWDGDYTSPGFIFDNVNIDTWAPFVQYRLGDIVSYRSFFWTSVQNHTSDEFFEEMRWTKLDLIPEKSLIPNFDFKINQFEDYFNLDSEGIISSQRDLGRHFIGYQQREYLNNLSEDSVTQFRLYQGFIREKGTKNSVTKIFDKLSKTDDDSIVINEEWAIKIGTLGGIDQLYQIEFQIEKNELITNPQPVIIKDNDLEDFNVDTYYRIDASDFVYALFPFTREINPVSYYTGIKRDAGYVKDDHVEYIVASSQAVTDIDISTIRENDHVWITFRDNTWDVVRFEVSSIYRIVRFAKAGSGMTIEVNRTVDFEIDEIIGIKNLGEYNGLYSVIAISGTTFTVSVAPFLTNTDSEISDFVPLYFFVPSRFATWSSVPKEQVALLRTGSKLWIDQDQDSRWEVVEKTKQYSAIGLGETGVSAPEEIGSFVLIAETLKQYIVGIPKSDRVITYIKSGEKLEPKFIITPPSGYDAYLQSSFGKCIAISSDNIYLAVGVPNASDVPSKFKGDYQILTSYREGDIVRYGGLLWQAKNDTIADGSTIDIYSQDWRTLETLNPDLSGIVSGLQDQGMVVIYKWQFQQWNLDTILISPALDDFENFGSSLSLSVDDDGYRLFIGAPESSGERGRVYLYKNINGVWKLDINQNYRGVYDPVGHIISADKIRIGFQYTIRSLGTTNFTLLGAASNSIGVDFVASAIGSGTGTVSYNFYPTASIVWYRGSLYQANEDVFVDGSTVELDLSYWTVIDPISTSYSLPTNASIENDGSSLTMGLLDPTQIAELTKAGDRFGQSLKTNRDGSILIVSAPNSDSQFFPSYKGEWKDYEIYKTDDVVRYQGSYHRLVNLDSTLIGQDSAQDSTFDTVTSIGEFPDAGLPWINVGDSTDTPSGKIFVYKRDENQLYQLVQTINTDSLSSISDLAPDEIISSGDMFGYALDIDSSGFSLIVSSPMADINLRNQGSVYLFKTRSLENPSYRLIQKLESYESFVSEEFGYSISISPQTQKIVVASRNGGIRITTFFDRNLGTSFDNSSTGFSSTKGGYPGQIYVFDRKDDHYFLAEKLEVEDFVTGESFGAGLDAASNEILVGSPGFVSNNIKTGTVRLFTKIPNNQSLLTLSREQPLINLDRYKNIFILDKLNNEKITEAYIVDHYKFRLLPQAEQEIKYKTPYDPAFYTDSIEIAARTDPTQSWFDKHVGEIWWDVSRVKWKFYEQGDISYRIGNWNTQVEGSSIELYEWVESNILPSQWNQLADTEQGLSRGISGTPLYPDDTAYCEKIIFNEITGQPSKTLYYYWVKNSKIVPKNAKGRRISTEEVFSLINDPVSSGLPIATPIDTDKFYFANIKGSLPVDIASINIEFYDVNNKINPVHREYKLLVDGGTTSLPPEQIEQKWIDSLVGYNLIGQKVPDETLPETQRYGLSLRPRQTMFKNRNSALKIVINKINGILQQRPFVDTIDFTLLNSIDPVPEPELNLYDTVVDLDTELETVGTVRIRPAVLSANIIDGEIDTVDIIDTGFGYRVQPPLVVTGTGDAAELTAIIDNLGRIIRVDVINRGKKYTQANISVRPFSILIRTDATISNFWSIYAWDNVRRIFYRTRTQDYDTKLYWKYINWWLPGYSIGSRIVQEIESYYLESTVNLQLGDLLRIKEYSNGGWAVLERVEEQLADISKKYRLVGRQDGTIEFLNSLYDNENTDLGFDKNSNFDTGVYDRQPVNELRNIIRAVKENIFIEDFSVEWNRLFFSTLRYILSEQTYVDWLFKTSFVSVKHNIGFLEQKINYKNDNLQSYADYLNEVKPYRTSVREFISAYKKRDNTNTIISDFDLPPYYDTLLSKILPVNSSSSLLQEYPYKFYQDNLGFGIVDIRITNSGSGYTRPPQVLIEGTGIGAEARAFISSGRLEAIQIINEGSGYTDNTRITLIGGNGADQNIARATAILGNSKVRTLDVRIKFDRISKEGFLRNFTQRENFVATGISAVFDLNFAPSNDKNKISVFQNNQLVLTSDYSTTFYFQEIGGYTVLKGRIIFRVVPDAGDTITVEYEKNDDLLDSVNRITKYYAPTAGMLGNDLDQLMTGIDYGGVQIQGNTFDVTGGWDALPWFTDGWDSVESSGDYYYVVDADIAPDSEFGGKIRPYAAGSVVFYDGKLYIANQSTVDNDVIILPGDDDWETFWDDFYIDLPFVPAAGQMISVYLKRASSDDQLIPTVDNLRLSQIPEKSRTIRVDDPYYDLYDGSTVLPNGRTVADDNILMPTFIGDGITSRIEIGLYLTAFPGDLLIFRTLESDGSVAITDVNIVDTFLSGGTLQSNTTDTAISRNVVDGAYSTANGITSEEISIEGGKFISPEQVPSPEENIPGQVLESVSLKVFTRNISGAAPIQSSIFYGDDVTTSYDIGLDVLEQSSIAVYIDRIEQSFDSTGISGYTIDYFNQQIVFSSAPVINSVIEILAIGIGGVSILDSQRFSADGETRFFLTQAQFDQTDQIFVSVDGQEVEAGFVNSTGLSNYDDKTMIEFAIAPQLLSSIEVVVFSATTDTDSGQLSLIKLNKQIVEFDGSTRLINPIGLENLSRPSLQASVLVSVNNRQLNNAEITYIVYDGTNNSVSIGLDPARISGEITLNNLKVFVNNVIITQGLNYSFDAVQNIVNVSQEILEIGDIIKIENSQNTDYTVVRNSIELSSDLSLAAGDNVEIIWFSEYPSMDIITDQYSGGRVRYQLQRPVLDVNYVWVYNNGNRLTKDIDYYIDQSKFWIYLKNNTGNNDTIKIVSFSNTVYQKPSAYEIFKDMLNRVHFKAFSKDVNIKLVKDLYYYEDEIFLNDASNFPDPIPSRNIPGIIFVNSERIEYFEKSNNTLKKLRRGTLGSSIAEVHAEGHAVIDVSVYQNIPYNEEEEKLDFVSDGSTLLIGPLSFVPRSGDYSNWYRQTIPQNYFQCDDIEIFVGGARLKKMPTDIFDETLGFVSPSADKKIEADFSVDGVSPFIRLTVPPPAGTRIYIIRKTGRTWYDRGTNSASKGITFFENQTDIIKFIKSKTSDLP